MYLRTTSRRNADGSVVRYYQLAENVWDPRRSCAVAKIIYNFGRADQVDGDKMRRLAASILRTFGGEQQAAARPTTRNVCLIFSMTLPPVGAPRFPGVARFPAQRGDLHGSLFLLTLGKS